MSEQHGNTLWHGRFEGGPAAERAVAEGDLRELLAADALGEVPRGEGVAREAGLHGEPVEVVNGGSVHAERQVASLGAGHQRFLVMHTLCHR